jgi:hypothetical protein
LKAPASPQFSAPMITSAAVTTSRWRITVSLGLYPSMCQTARGVTFNVAHSKRVGLDASNA